jgi:hypothetical protein
MAPKTDTELLPVLLELVGSKIPVSQWPTQMKKSQRVEHAREVLQAEAAAGDRPQPRADAKSVTAAMGDGDIPRLWPQRAQQASESLDAERRRRREQAVPAQPELPPALGASYRERNLFLLPDEDQDEDGSGAAGGPDRSGRQ